MALLETDNERLQTDHEHIMRENLSSIAEKNMWKNRFSEVYLSNRNLKAQFQKLENDTDELHKRTTSFDKRLETIIINLESKQNTLLKKTSRFKKQMNILLVRIM